jgi:hypothetical protein
VLLASIAVAGTEPTIAAPEALRYEICANNSPLFGAKSSAARLFKRKPFQIIVRQAAFLALQ